MKPDRFAQLLAAALPGTHMVALYGSAVSGDQTSPRSDYDILLVCENFTMDDLKLITPLVRRWMLEGNPPPLLFTRTNLEQAADVFPIEILDMQQAHRVLSGDDVLSGIVVSRDNLRLQVERELREKRISLYEGYLAAGGRPRRLWRLMTDSLTSILVIFRAALRLLDDNIPMHKIVAAERLAHHLPLDSDVLRKIALVRQKKLATRKLDCEALFARYLENVEKVTAVVDALPTQANAGESK